MSYSLAGQNIIYVCFMLFLVLIQCLCPYLLDYYTLWILSLEEHQHRLIFLFLPGVWTSDLCCWQTSERSARRKLKDVLPMMNRSQ
jgi:hypothetical protein